MNSNRISQCYCAIVVLTTAIWLGASTINTNTAMIIMVIAITAIGLPHGALDFAIAQLMGLCPTPTKVTKFIIGYLLVVGACVVFWLLFPAIALMIFVIISAHHFASDWQDSLTYWLRLSLSSMTLCAPSILYAPVLSDIFALLFLSPIEIQAILFTLQVTTLVSGLFLVGAVILGRQVFKRLTDWQIGEVAVLLISSFLITPLLHFTLYFCFLHSTKHFVHTAKALSVSLKRAIWLSLPFVFLTIFGAFFIAWTGPQRWVNTALLQYLFIGLFGLTVAHMLLTEHWRFVTKTS